MTKLVYKTKNNVSPKDKPKVFFSCHPDDFDRYFEQICEDIFKTYDCAIFYTEDMTAQLDDENRDLDLYSMNLFVIPVTFRLLTEANRAMDEDYVFADKKHIPVLPLMMESSINELFSRRFGERQYIYVYENDPSKLSYSEQLEKYLNTVFLNKETVERIRKAFDAYIFLSYRKKDRRYANELMRMIHSYPMLEKLAIWYDEFLTPGESFMENIQKILSDSQLFTLLVTPNLLEKPNFVMEHEYPAARDSGKPILPAQMVDTDFEQLKAEYTDIPDVIEVQDKVVFNTQFLDALRRYAVTESLDDPEHNYLIGLAYLDGIDVEVDKEHGVQMITAAAEADLPEAMEKLWDFYTNGIHVEYDYYEALRWAKRLYNHHKNILGKKHHYSLAWLNTLAFAYSNIGDYKTAIKLNELCYNLRLEVSGEKHPDTLTSLNNTAHAYSNIGDWRKAFELTELCYKLHCEVFGEKHHESLRLLNNFASAYGALGNYQKMIELGELCYKIRCEVIGEKHPDTLISLSNLAYAYGKVGDLGKRFELAELCYNYRCNILGNNHPDTLISLNILADTYRKAGEYQTALKMTEFCYRSRCKIFGDKHPITLNTLHSLAYVYNDYGDSQKALELDELCYKMRCKVFGENHLYTIRSMDDVLYHHKKLNHQQQIADICEYVYQHKIIQYVPLLKRVYNIYSNSSFMNTEKAEEIKQRLNTIKTNPD